MSTNINFWCRKRRSGPESEMVEAFIAQYQYIFSIDSYESTVFTEPCLDSGFPDILIVFWDKKALLNWSAARNKLTKNDVKLLHHIAVSQNGYNLFFLCQQLGYSEKEIKGSLGKLTKADLIYFKKGAYKAYELEDIFAVRRIISIEAKMQDWKNALFQAQMNELFSSHSYILLPTNKVNDQVVGCLKNGNSGLLSLDDSGVKLVREASKLSIPASFYSWVINENIGRSIHGNMVCKNK